MNVINKIKAVLSDAKMSKAYINWLVSRTFMKKSPRIKFSQSETSIGEWSTFSEYWSFRDLIPKSEHLLVQNSLAGKSPIDSAVMDIGANVGMFTCLMASMGFSVHAFEPIPDTFCRMKNNVKYNGFLKQTDLNCMAVGSQQGLVRFQVEENASATNRIAPAGGELGGELIATVSLDQYCSEQSIQNISFLKIDVEGMEPYVLQGAKGLLSEKKVAVILIEICPVNLKGAGFSCADLYHEFEVARYSPYLLNNDGTSRYKLSLKEIEAMSLANVVLLPEN